MAIIKALYANNAAGQLAAGVGASDTALLLGAGQGVKFPAPNPALEYFYVTVVHAGTGAIEVMKCTGRTVDTLSVERGQDGTTAIAFTAGSVVELRLVAQLLRDLDYRAVAGLANGIATLDANVKVPAAQMPTSVPIMDGASKILDGNIPATIARQTAVDAKVAKAGDTMTGTLTINRGTNAADATVETLLLNGNIGLGMYARAAVDTSNPLVEANDSVLLFRGAALNNACALFIGPWSSSNFGLRLTSTGGATINGNNIHHAGNFDPATKLNVASPAFTGTGTGTTLNLTGNLRADGGFLYLNNAQTRYVQWDNAATWYKLPGGSGVEAVDFKGTSDRRLKANIAYRDADPYLADKLRIANFLWKESGLAGIGPIAQDVKRVAPQYVSNTGKHLAVSHAGLALEAVIGLAARVRNLEEKADKTCSTDSSKTRKSASSKTRSHSSNART